MILLAQIIFIEESFADAFNADKNSAASWSLNFFLRQWFIDRTSFHDGRRPGISSEKIRTGVWEESENAMIAGFHFKTLSKKIVPQIIVTMITKAAGQLPEDSQAKIKVFMLFLAR